MTKYEIEDRTKMKAPTFGAGKYVVWELRAEPFPCRLFAAVCDTHEQATAWIAERTQVMLQSLKARKGGAS